MRTSNNEGCGKLVKQNKVCFAPLANGILKKDVFFQEKKPNAIKKVETVDLLYTSLLIEDLILNGKTVSGFSFCRKRRVLNSVEKGYKASSFIGQPSAFAPSGLSVWQAGKSEKIEYCLPYILTTS